METKFYEYRQNNSGGSFHRDEKIGIDEYVYIEAESAEEANTKAEKVGLYFEGKGDCECCGNRWSEASEHDVCDRFLTYPEDSYFHYKDGSILKVEITWVKR